MRIADLPWYDLPELRAATDAWWRGIAAHLRQLGVDPVPTELRRDVAHDENWRHPGLLLSQACGYDVLYDVRDVLQPIATPCYELEGCTGPRYSSVVVVRADNAAATIADLRGSRCSVNEATSHSGTNALRPLVAEHSRGGRFFASVTASGSHTDSLAMLRCGAADVACIDAVVFELVRRVRAHDLVGLRVLARTRLAMAPPYVTSMRTPPDLVSALQEALRRAVRDPELAACRRELGIADVAFVPPSSYRELAVFEDAALAHGYFELPAPQRSPLTVAARAAGHGRERDASRPPRTCAEGSSDRR